MEDSFGELTHNPVTGHTKIVEVSAEGAFQLDLHAMPDCECACSGVVTLPDRVFYGPVTINTALRALKDLPHDVLAECGEMSSLREKGVFSEHQPWSALPRSASSN